MARVKGGDFDEMFEQPTRAAEEVGEWAARKRPARKVGPPKWSTSKIAKFDSELLEMVNGKGWDGVQAEHLVSLYRFCHHKVYGVRASEVDGVVFPQATRTARALVEAEFSGDFDEAIRFMQWLWKREKEREQWRRDNKREGGVIGWRLQFSATTVPQYKIHLARKASGSL